MTPHPVKQLRQFVLNRLESDERRIIDEHLQSCPSCSNRLKELDAALSSTTPMNPSPNLRDRLFQSVEHLERFTRYAPRLAELIDIPMNDARRALHAFSEVNHWNLQPLPGMRAFPLAPGASRSHWRAILACFDPAGNVPNHRHDGTEWIVVYQGAFETSDGRIIRAGDELHSEPGSVHSVVRILEGVQCFCAIINTDRIEYLQQS